MMSRFYELVVRVKGLTADEVTTILCEGMGWECVDSDNYDSVTVINLEGYLRAGETQENAHDLIYEKLKSLNKNAKIKTEWRCLEDIPYDEYGDDDYDDEEGVMMTEKHIRTIMAETKDVVEISNKQREAKK